MVKCQTCFNLRRKIGHRNRSRSNGRKINAAVEDVRFAITNDELAIKYKEANDQLNSVLDTSIYSIPAGSGNEDDDDTTNTEPEELGTTRDLCVGDEIEVYWPLDNKFYTGSITEYNENTGKLIIAYDDGQNENLNMKHETWRILNTNQVSISDITSINNEALKEYFQTFPHKEFMMHQAQGLLPHPVWNAYNDEEVKFMKTVRKVPIEKVPKNLIVITSQVIYKVKENDDDH